VPVRGSAVALSAHPSYRGRMSGPLRLGPSDGRLVLRTFREGLAAQVGHDLVLEFTVWSAEAAPPEAEGGARLEVRIDLTSLRALEGTGGVKPLTDRDKRDIAGNARKALDAEHHPEAVFRSTSFTPTEHGGVFDGTLTLRGVERPLRFAVTRTGDGRLRGRATVRQTEHGVKPYSAFLGALKLRDAVEVDVDVAAAPAAPPVP